MSEPAPAAAARVSRWLTSTVSCAPAGAMPAAGALAEGSNQGRETAARDISAYEDSVRVDAPDEQVDDRVHGERRACTGLALTQISILDARKMYTAAVGPEVGCSRGRR
jgi:hypothetical protein